MTLVEKLLLVPAVGQMALIFGLMLWLGWLRVGAVNSGAVKIKDIALTMDAYPLRAVQVSNAVNNQFQLPVLFFVGVLLSLWSGTTGWLEVVLAFAFVVLRIAHALIHITHNRVTRRFQVYAVGFFVLLAYWLALAVALFAMSGSN